jgi:hypothetical protein
MIKKFCDQWIQDWCDENGWTDLFIDRRRYWAFPPGAVMPLPVPDTALQAVKGQKGLSFAERMWMGAAIGVTLVASASSYWLASPMPLVTAFVVCALIVANLDEDDV